MDPDRIVNTSTVCILVLKGLIWAIPGVNLSGGGVTVSVLAGLCFYKGITTLADEFTGQKTIRVIGTRRGEIKIQRDDRFSYILAIFGAFMFTILGALFFIFAW